MDDAKRLETRIQCVCVCEIKKCTNNEKFNPATKYRDRERKRKLNEMYEFLMLLGQSEPHWSCWLEGIQQYSTQNSNSKIEKYP